MSHTHPVDAYHIVLGQRAEAGDGAIVGQYGLGCHRVEVALVDVELGQGTLQAEDVEKWGRGRRR